MKKKTIKATVSAVSIATAFAGISAVKADEVTATQPNELTLSVESNFVYKYKTSRRSIC